MKKIVFIILLLVFSLVGCSTVKTQESVSQGVDSQKQLLEPKQVVENYFKYFSEKNLQGVNSTRTQWSQITEVSKDIKYIKLNSIAEDTRASLKEDYIKYGHGIITGATEENIRVFKIEYTMKYKIGAIRTQDSDEYLKWCVLIRKDKNSPWLIDEIGEG